MNPNFELAPIDDALPLHLYHDALFFNSVRLQPADSIAIRYASRTLDLLMSTDDPLIEALEHSNAGVAPPPFGKLTLEILGAPASIQAKRVVRDAYITQIKAALSKFGFVLTGQILLDITWHVPAKSRYETDAKADIDNCLKPIIDAFTGPDGIMIDDCQLKGLYVSWTHISSGDERLSFDFKFDADHFCDRDGLAFIRLEKGLCCPVNTKWPIALKAIWVKAIRAGERCKAVLEQADVSYLVLAGMLGGGQPFHVTRTGGFRVLSAEDFATEASSKP